MADTPVIYISERRPQQALAALRRMTGVNWERLPESLLSQVRQAQGVLRGNELDWEFARFFRQSGSVS